VYFHIFKHNSFQPPTPFSPLKKSIANNAKVKKMKTKNNKQQTKQATKKQKTNETSQLTFFFFIKLD
jgi:hypothetical protein